MFQKYSILLRRMTIDTAMHVRFDKLHDGETRRSSLMPDTLAWLVNELQRSPTMRAIVYFGGAVVILETGRTGIDFTRPDATIRLHLRVFPCSAALTYLMLRLEGRTDVTNIPIRSNLAQALAGAGFGATAWLLVLGIAHAKGWISLPAWGWEQTPRMAVIRSMTLNGIGQLAVAWNEEMLFRGYGFETLRAAVGTSKAAGLLIPLFALYHGFSPQVLVGMSVAGTLFAILRLQTNDVWFGIGYHWAWNMMQTAIFGPPDGLPSIRPLHVHGPTSWIGRPGQAEPGWLSTLVSLAAIFLAGMVWWLQRRRSAR